MTHEERRSWLMSVSEDDSFKLPLNDWYDRVRFLREKLGAEQIKSRPAQTKQTGAFVVPFNAVTKGRKDWTDR